MTSPTEQPSRRAVLRMAASAPLLLGASAALAVATSAPALAAQAGWRWCERCSGLWYSLNGTRGTCPAGNVFDGGHHSNGSGNYILKTVEDGGRGQGNWRWCGACQGLWYGGNPTLGYCPNRGATGHTPIGPYPTVSSYYLIEDVGNRDSPGGQEQWRWCYKCAGMFFDGNTPGGSGRCPKDGLTHAVTGGSYVLRQVP